MRSKCTEWCGRCSMMLSLHYCQKQDDLERGRERNAWKILKLCLLLVVRLYHWRKKGLCMVQEEGIRVGYKQGGPRKRRDKKKEKKSDRLIGKVPSGERLF